MKSLAAPTTTIFALLALTAFSLPAHAVQYPNIDPNYSQQIYTGPLVGDPGMAWTPSNNPLTRNGVERFNPSNWAAPAQLMPGSIAGGAGYGITTLPDGRIAYSDGAFTSHVWVYDPVAFTNNLIYTAPTGYLIDGMVSGPGG